MTHLTVVGGGTFLGQKELEEIGREAGKERSRGNVGPSPSHHGFPGGSVVMKLPGNAGDAGSIPGSGRSPGVGNGNLPQYSSLGNPMGRGAWQATVHEVPKSQTRLSD